MKDFVPLVQTAIWAGVVIWVLRAFEAQIQGLIDSVRKRVEQGSEVVVKAGGVTIKPPKMELLEKLKSIPPELHDVAVDNTDSNLALTANEISNPNTPEEWSLVRDGIYRNQRGLFLSHMLSRSTEPGQVFDIYISLFSHKDGSFEDVKKAEFFLGKHWGNKAILGANLGGIIGMRTSAYGPFLCVCKVTFKDGETVLIDRYIDFEMGTFIPAT